MLTIEELHIHYKNVRERINNAANKKPEVKIISSTKSANENANWKNVFDDAKEKYGVIKTPYMDIVREVCKAHDIPREIVFSKTRKKNVPLARGLIYDRIRKELGWSYPKIGRLFKVDHTTVLHGIKMARKYKSENEGGAE